MYIYIFIYIYNRSIQRRALCVYTYMYIYIYIQTLIYLHTYTHIYIYIYIDTYIFPASSAGCHVYIHMCIYIYTHTHIYTYIHIQIYRYIYITSIQRRACIYTHMYISYTYILTYIHKYYIYRYLHTYINTYIDTYILPASNAAIAPEPAEVIAVKTPKSKHVKICRQKSARQKKMSEVNPQRLYLVDICSDMTFFFGRMSTLAVYMICCVSCCKYTFDTRACRACLHCDVAYVCVYMHVYMCVHVCSQ